jgi:rod shape determining protein RodA
MIDRKLIAQTDWLLFTVTVLLSLAGIALIFTATHAQGPYYFHRQSYWLLVGLSIIIPIILFDYSILERLGYVIFGLSLLTLVLVLIIGETVGGAQRWLSLGFISIQPSEFAKLAFIIALAKYFSTSRVRQKGMKLQDLFIPLILLAVPFLLIAKEPDLGTALIFGFIFTSMVLIIKVRKRIIIGAIMLFIPLVPLAFFSLKDYQKARLLSFLDPAKDPLGSGYHLLQSKIAIGSGGFFGMGYTKGTQGSLMFLPERHTDFIFPIMAEELGFVGSIILLGLFLVFIMRGIETAGTAKDRFGFLLAYGITAMIFWHFAINIAMVVGLLPVVGVPLPFISYGGSFLITTLIGSGILLNISMRRFVLG